jgi:hypothetical protein
MRAPGLFEPVHRGLCLLATLLVIVVACAMTPERLPELDRRFYYNLPSREDQAAFLRVSEPQRQGFLEDKGLWQRWVALPPAERDSAKQGTVELGHHEFALFIAWGPPADTQSLDRGGRGARMHTYIRCSSGPKRGQFVLDNLQCDGTSDETQVVVQNDVIVEIRYPN